MQRKWRLESTTRCMGTQDTRGSWANGKASRAFPFVKAHKGECPIFLPETLINTTINKIKMDIRNTREYKAAKELERALNDYGWNPSRFAECTNLFHRTLQQSLIRTVVAIIRMMGDEEYATDPRNRASHELCRRIVESGVLDDACLPFI